MFLSVMSHKMPPVFCPIWMPPSLSSLWLVNFPFLPSRSVDLETVLFVWLDANVPVWPSSPGTGS